MGEVTGGAGLDTFQGSFIISPSQPLPGHDALAYRHH